MRRTDLGPTFAARAAQLAATLAAALAAAFFMACGGPSFGNVKATAGLGRDLGQYSIEADVWITECQASQAASSTETGFQLCLEGDRYRAMVNSVQQTSLLLQRYALSLLEAADGDVTTAASVTAVMGQVSTLNTDVIKESVPKLFNIATILGEDQALVGKLTPQGINTIVDTIVQFTSRRVRQKALASAITEAAPHVDTLLAFLEAEVELHLATVADLQRVMQTAMLLRPMTRSPDAEQRALAVSAAQMLPLVTARLDERVASLRRLVAACQGFRVAHAKLAKQIQAGKNWKDRELLEELKVDLKKIAAAAF